MGHGLTTFTCPIPLGYARRSDGSAVHPADAEAVIRERAQGLTGDDIDEIELRTGHYDPSTVEDAIVEAWQGIMADVNPETPATYCNVIELDLADGGETWFTASVNGGDYPCAEAEWLTLLDASGVCDEPMPWWEPPAAECGFLLFPDKEDPALAAMRCTLAPFHRGDKHATTIGGTEVVTVLKDLPEGVDPWPPVIIAQVGGDQPAWVEKFGCDPVVVIIDKGAHTPDETDEWLDGITETAAGFPEGHPARDELEQFVAEHQED